MKKMNITRLAMAAAVLCTPFFATAEPMAYIKFAEKYENNQPVGKMCTYSFPHHTSVQVNVADLPGCSNDTYSYFKLESVPSAALITLSSEKDCATNVDDWYFTLRTIKHPTETDWYHIPQLLHDHDKKIIVAGLRMEKNYYDHGNIKGKLSCFLIERP